MFDGFENTIPAYENTWGGFSWEKQLNRYPFICS